MHPWNWGHAARVEKNEKKQTFLQDMFTDTDSEKTPMINDAADMHGKGLVTDVLTDTPIPVPDADISWCAGSIIRQDYKEYSMGKAYRIALRASSVTAPPPPSVHFP
jgi:hypothetical protein